MHSGIVGGTKGAGRRYDWTLAPRGSAFWLALRTILAASGLRSRPLRSTLRSTLGFARRRRRLVFRGVAEHQADLRVARARRGAVREIGDLVELSWCDSKGNSLASSVPTSASSPSSNERTMPRRRWHPGRVPYDLRPPRRLPISLFRHGPRPPRGGGSPRLGVVPFSSSGARITLSHHPGRTPPMASGAPTSEDTSTSSSSATPAATPSPSTSVLRVSTATASQTSIIDVPSHRTSPSSAAPPARIHAIVTRPQIMYLESTCKPQLPLLAFVSGTSEKNGLLTI